MASFIGAFSHKEIARSAIKVELLALIETVSVAWLKVWRRLWLETNFTHVLHYFTFPYLIPWCFRTSWANCLHIAS